MKLVGDRIEISSCIFFNLKREGQQEQKNERPTVCLLAKFANLILPSILYCGNAKCHP